MAVTSTIEWTDATWNPVTGCTKVSPGCDNCYAETFAERWRGIPGHHFEAGFDVTLRPNALTLPLRWRRPRRVFVNSMSDLFHQDVPDSYIARVFAVMALTPQHTYQILTKRHGRMRSLIGGPCKCGHQPGEHLRSGMAWAASKANADRVPGVADDAESIVYGRGIWPLPNVWLGVSVEDQQRADLRVPALQQTPAAVRFLSCEPLLGPVDVSPWLGDTDSDEPGSYKDGIHWLIVGGESGHGARPMHPQWARDLRDQCAAANVPFFFKQFGAWGLEAPLDAHGSIRPGPRGMGITVADDGTVYQPGDLTYPDGPRYGEAIRAGHAKAHLTGMYRVGKKAAGRVLDGRTWDELPEVAR